MYCICMYMAMYIYLNVQAGRGGLGGQSGDGAPCNVNFPHAFGVTVFSVMFDWVITNEGMN